VAAGQERSLEEISSVDLGHGRRPALGRIACRHLGGSGLGSVLGYLAPGLLIDLFGLRLFSRPEALMHMSLVWWSYECRHGGR